MPISKTLLEQTFCLEKWVKDKALPFWSSIGINPENASVYEQLDDSGQPDLSANIRSRVQSRQVFVFASAQNMGWMDNALPIIAGIDNFLNVHARNAGEGYAHLLSPEGKIIDPRKDAYDFAFYILACAYRYKTFSDLNALDQANRLVKFLEAEFKKAPGGWMEGNYGCQYRRQNPHMHLFEAFLSCYEFTQDGKWLAKAGQVYTLFETTFFDHKHAVIREHFEDNWSLAPFPHGQIVEPGHMFEWIWLLRWYQKLTGAPVDGYCDKLYENALKLGLSGNSHLIYDEVMADGTIIKASKRLWPITELIKASLAQAQVHPTKAERYEEHAAKGIKTLFDFYLRKNVSAYETPAIEKQQPENVAVDAYTGTYVDQLDAEDKVCAAHSPASTLYHIAMAAIVAVNYQKGK
jgi:mannose/cellobiose epimerase-like protein (N-acyl-D-glucosamine 2-epimerase family)